MAHLNVAGTQAYRREPPRGRPRAAELRLLQLCMELQEAAMRPGADRVGYGAHGGADSCNVL